MKVIILSGISGSGKTTFLRALEDIGYFCVDNFPLILLQKFLEVCELTGGKVAKTAFVVDIRVREFFDAGKTTLHNIKDKYNAEFVFLESSDDMLIRRFKETRRAHPLYDSSNIREALKEERELVSWIKDIADKIIDTSNFTLHELRRFVLNTYSQDKDRMKINLMSFGYVYGIPTEADMVLDVRFLSNPFFVDELREKTGLSDDVRAYMKSDEVYKKYFKLLLDFLVYLIPLYEKEGKSYLTIGFGCTGGKHRSVFIVNELAVQFSTMDYNVSAIHRDIDR